MFEQHGPGSHFLKFQVNFQAQNQIIQIKIIFLANF